MRNAVASRATHVLQKCHHRPPLNYSHKIRAERSCKIYRMKTCPAWHMANTFRIECWWNCCPVIICSPLFFFMVNFDTILNVQIHMCIYTAYIFHVRLLLCTRELKISHFTCQFKRSSVYCIEAADTQTFTEMENT